MKVSEIIEMTQQQPLSEIAKRYLKIGEKPARKAMRLAGCYTITGRTGWMFDDTENVSNLERSIYEFSDEVRAIEKKELLQMAKVGTNEQTEYVPRKRHSFDLDVRLVKELKLHCVEEDQTLYEAVEKSIRDYLDIQKGRK